MIVKAQKIDTELFIEIEFPEGVDTVTLSIESSRNKDITFLSQRSPACSENIVMNQSPDKEIWFPAVDVELVPGLRARAIFDKCEPVSFNINGYANCVLFESKNGVCDIDAKYLAYWENGLFCQDGSAKLISFCYELEIDRIPATTAHVTKIIKLITPQWDGTASAYYFKDGLRQLIGKATVAELTASAPTIASYGNSLNNALSATVSFTMGCVNENTISPLYKGFNLFYDHDARIYRQPSWIWGWGPTLKLLVDCAKNHAVCGEFDSAALLKTAWRAGRTSLGFQTVNKNHIMDGSGTARWNVSPLFNRGYKECINGGSDAGFLIGWGWLPIFNATGDKEFLERAAKYALHIERMLDVSAVPPQEYLPELGSYTDTTIDESGFGSYALSELYAATGDQFYADLCLRYMDQHLDVYDDGKGLWHRQYCHSMKRIDIDSSSDDVITRGQGWAMNGLLAGHYASKNKNNKYLKKAVEMAQRMIDFQNADGSFQFYMNASKMIGGIGEKATALWSLLFYMLYNETGDTLHLGAARKALRWCINNQYLGNDIHGYGGIPGCNRHSAVVYRQYFNISCLYTSGFFGLALMEEMKKR